MLKMTKQCAALMHIADAQRKAKEYIKRRAALSFAESEPCVSSECSLAGALCNAVRAYLRDLP